jgi:hypothetical protein
MDPVGDRHVGQKNEQLVLAGQGQQIRIPLLVLNVSPLPMQITMEIQPLISRTIPPLLAIRAKSPGSGLEGLHLRPPTSVLPVVGRLSNEPALYSGPDPFFARRLLSMSIAEARGTARDSTIPAQFSLCQAFAPWEGRDLQIEARVPADSRPGQTFAFRVVQRADRMVTGGYTIYVVVPAR